MSDLQLYNQISTLPVELKKEVEDFVEFLKYKSVNNGAIKERKFGYAKNFFKMEKNFDEPIDDFNEYQ